MTAFDPFELADLPDTVEEVRGWVKLPAAALGDEDLVRMYRAAVGTVVKSCRVPRDEVTGDPVTAGWPSELVQAVLRRTQRQIAAKNLPLGVLDQAGEYGPARIPHYDQLIEELEGPFRIVVFG